MKNKQWDLKDLLLIFTGVIVVLIVMLIIMSTPPLQ